MVPPIGFSYVASKRFPVAEFYLGFFVGGKSFLKKIFEPRGGKKKILGLLGGPGACSLGKV